MSEQMGILGEFSVRLAADQYNQNYCRLQNPKFRKVVGGLVKYRFHWEFLILT